MKIVTRNMTTDTIAVLHKLAHDQRRLQVERLLSTPEDDDFETSQIYDRIVELDRAIDELLGLA
jgi:hypothetical protein